MIYHFLRGVGHFLARLNPQTIERWAFALAYVAFDVLRLRRRVVLGNLAIAYPQMPPAERLELGRKSVYNFLLNTAEFFRGVDIDIAGDIDVVGHEYLKQALDQNKGVYILCGHMGNWEAMGAKFTKSLCPAHVLVKPVGRGGVKRFVDTQRENSRFLIIKRLAKGDGMKAIREVLAKNEVVGFVIDQARPGEPRLPFFDVPAKTNTSFAAIWSRSPAPILPAFMVRRSLGRHTLHILPELILERGASRAQDVVDHSVRFNQVMADMIRQAPDQYFWLHNRWK